MALVINGLSNRQDSTSRSGTQPLAPRAGRAGDRAVIPGGDVFRDRLGDVAGSKWTSTIYGVMLIIADALATLALMIVVAGFLAADRPMSRDRDAGPFQRLGNLLLAFVMLWAYMSFCQFLIIWSGNLTEEIPWYLRRTSGRLAVGGPRLDLSSTFFCRFSCCLFRDEQARDEQGIAGGSLDPCSCTGSTWSGWSSRPLPIRPARRCSGPRFS